MALKHPDKSGLIHKWVSQLRKGEITEEILVERISRMNSVFLSNQDSIFTLHSPHNEHSASLAPGLRAPKRSQRISTPARTIDVHRARSGSFRKTHDEDIFYKRSVEWKRWKEKVNLLKKRELEEKEVSSCTFHPNPDTQRVPDVLAENLCSRLYAEHDAFKHNRLEMQKKYIEQRKEELSQKCTFAPKLTKASRSFFKKNKAKIFVRRKLMKTKQESIIDLGFKSSSDVHSQKKRNRTRHRSCIPGSNSIQEPLVLSENYINEKLTKRLMAGGRERSSEKDRYSAAVSEKERRRRASSAASFQEFIHRQDALLARKESSVQNTVSYFAKKYFKPKLSERSKKLAETRVGRTMESRMKTYRSKSLQRSHQREEIRLKEEAQLFKPKISARARRTRAKSVDELAMRKIHRTHCVDKIKHKIDDAEDMKPREVFRIPIKYKATPSRIQTTLDSQSYIGMLRKHESSRRRRRDEYKRKGEEIELQECTFHPQLFQARSHISSIIMNMEKHSSRKPALEKRRRPGWI